MIMTTLTTAEIQKNITKDLTLNVNLKINLSRLSLLPLMLLLDKLMYCKKKKKVTYITASLTTEIIITFPKKKNKNKNEEQGRQNES